jgi:hypothetical protein
MKTTVTFRVILGRVMIVLPYGQEHYAVAVP